MKKYSEIRESLFNNQQLNNLGVTNRYSPIGNIILNVKNYFGATYGIVVTEGSNNSVELRCSRWINTDETYRDLSGINVGGKTITSYIYEQGLNAMKLIAEGQRITAVFYAPDVKNDTTKELNALPDATDYTDSHANEDYEIISYHRIENGMLVEGKDDDEEMEDKTPQEIRDLITSEDKVKAAEKFAELMSSKFVLPPEYYWKAVKDKDGNESIALRHKTEKRRPFGKKAEIVDSIINIYGEGDEAIWVDGYDNIETMPEDMKDLIENVLNVLGAEKTGDVCVYSLKELGNKDEDDDNDSDSESDNNDEDDNNSEATL